VPEVIEIIVNSFSNSKKNKEITQEIYSISNEDEFEKIIELLKNIKDKKIVRIFEKRQKNG